MAKKGISQEVLKLIACVAMLLDHIGAVLIPGNGLRIIGRLAFPIYCFLLVEGVAHTHDLKKYGQRLLLGALLSEVPFDYLFYGGINWQHQSVMLTLLIGFLMIVWARKRRLYLLPFCICFFAAEFLCTDYGGFGIAVIAVFMVTAEKNYEKLLQVIGMVLIFWAMDSYRVAVFGMRIPIQMFALLAMLPISFYSGRKLTRSRAVQWSFYLFYPVHLAVLFLISLL